MQTSSTDNTTPNPTRYDVHRIVQVRVSFRGIKAPSAEIAADVAGQADLHTVLEREEPTAVGLLRIESVALEQAGAITVQVDPLDEDGSPCYSEVVILAEDRAGQVYRLPPPHRTEAVEALHLMDRLAASAVDTATTDAKANVLDQLIMEARAIKSRHRS